MGTAFRYDVFLSYSSRDRAIVRPIAERLRSDGIQVWFDDWNILPGDNILATIEDGLESSRVLVLCMSRYAFGSDWAQLESGTFRFRDPLNRERRLIPLRLDDAEIPSSLAQFQYIRWSPGEGTDNYATLVEACSRPRTGVEAILEQRDENLVLSRRLSIDCPTRAFAVERDGGRLLTGSEDGVLRQWDLTTGRCLAVLEQHQEEISSIAVAADGHRAFSVSEDASLVVWDIRTGKPPRLLREHTDQIVSVACSPNGRFAVTGAEDRTVRVWDLDANRCIRALEGHTAAVWSVAIDHLSGFAFSAGEDNVIRAWDFQRGVSHRLFEGHSAAVRSIAWNPLRSLLASGGYDRTVRIWDVQTGTCVRVLEGHTGFILCVAWSDDGRFIASGGGEGDCTVRVWDANTGECLRRFPHDSFVWGLTWLSDGGQLLSADETAEIRIWQLRDASARMSKTETQVQYTNAKVLLVGESGAGKTGLSKRLALNQWQPSDSTVGAWATHWKLPVRSADNVEREIWLWDFGGQADQRLIHQLYMDETALAVLVFDAQKEDVFETLGQWDRDLTRCSRRPFAKVLVAGRSDAGGFRVSRAQLDIFRTERGYLRLIETSAKTNYGCDELRAAILDGIRWENMVLRCFRWVE